MVLSRNLINLPSFFCVPLRMYEIYFSTGKKKNKQSESTTIGRF